MQETSPFVFPPFNLGRGEEGEEEGEGKRRERGEGEEEGEERQLHWQPPLAKKATTESLPLLAEFHCHSGSGSLSATGSGIIMIIETCQ